MTFRGLPSTATDGVSMSITSASICAAADQLQGFVGFNAKTGRYIVRSCEFVWRAFDGELMNLDRARLKLLQEQNIDDRLNISEPLRIYLRRTDLPEISAERRRLNA
jgi:hypothetical protein